MHFNFQLVFFASYGISANNSNRNGCYGEVHCGKVTINNRSKQQFYGFTPEQARKSKQWIPYKKKQGQALLFCSNEI